MESHEKNTRKGVFVYRMILAGSRLSDPVS